MIEPEDEYFRELFNFIDWHAQSREQNDTFTKILSCIKDKYYKMKTKLEEQENVR